MSAIRKFLADIGSWIFLAMSCFAVEVVRDRPSLGRDAAPEVEDDLTSVTAQQSAENNNNKETK